MLPEPLPTGSFIIEFPNSGKPYGRAIKLYPYPVTGTGLVDGVGVNVGVTDGVGVGDDVSVGVPVGVLVGVAVFVGVTVGVDVDVGVGSIINGLRLVCVTPLLFVTVCIPELSVVTTAPNIKYLVFANDVRGPLGVD